MTERLRLVKPTEKLQAEYMDFYRDWVDSGEKPVPWAIRRDSTDFKERVHILHGNRIKRFWIEVSP